MSKEQAFMGAAVAILCLGGTWKAKWLLAHTKKGQRLVHRLGEQRALRFLRLLLVIGATFGILLAVDVIRPIQW